MLHMSETTLEALSPFAARVAKLGRIIKLSALERDILSFAFLIAVSDELIGIFEQLASDRWSARVLWTVLFDTTAEELAKALRPRSPLRLSGLLQPAGRRVAVARVPAFWVDVIASSDSITDALLEPLDEKVGSGRPARLLEEDLALAIRLLKHAKEPGVNLLLYGEASLEKTAASTRHRGWLGAHAVADAPFRGCRGPYGRIQQGNPAPQIPRRRRMRLAASRLSPDR